MIDQVWKNGKWSAHVHDNEEGDLLVSIDHEDLGDLSDLMWDDAKSHMSRAAFDAVETITHDTTFHTITAVKQAMRDWVKTV